MACPIRIIIKSQRLLMRVGGHVKSGSVFQCKLFRWGKLPYATESDDRNRFGSIGNWGIMLEHVPYQMQ